MSLTQQYLDPRRRQGIYPQGFPMQRFSPYPTMGPPMAGLEQLYAQIIAANMAQQGQSQSTEEEIPTVNPYLEMPVNQIASSNYRSRVGPDARQMDMRMRYAALHANDAAEAQQRMDAATAAREAEEAKFIHPPAEPGSYSIEANPKGGQLLDSIYGNGSVTFAPVGTKVHGTFGPDNLPFGRIGGIHAGQPLPGVDPMQETWQQRQLADMLKKKEIHDHLKEKFGI